MLVGGGAPGQVSSPQEGEVQGLGFSQAAHDGQGCPLTTSRDPDLTDDGREDASSFHQSSLLQDNLKGKTKNKPNFR